jgi:hypothetical protein
VRARLLGALYTLASRKRSFAAAASASKAHDLALELQGPSSQRHGLWWKKMFRRSAVSAPPPLTLRSFHALTIPGEQLAGGTVAEAASRAAASVSTFFAASVVISASALCSTAAAASATLPSLRRSNSCALNSDDFPTRALGLLVSGLAAANASSVRPSSFFEFFFHEATHAALLGAFLHVVLHSAGGQSAKQWAAWRAESLAVRGLSDRPLRKRVRHRSSR